MGRADHKGHVSCPTVCAVGKELRQLVGGDLPALNAHSHDGSALAHVGQDGLALLVQCLFYHGIRGVLLLDLFLRQLNDAEGREGGKALLVLGHALCKVFCIELADTDQVDILHNVVSFTEASGRCFALQFPLLYRNDLKLSPLRSDNNSGISIFTGGVAAGKCIFPLRDGCKPTAARCRLPLQPFL